MIVKLLKALNLYTPIKRLKDDIHFNLRENLSFNKEMLFMYKDFIKEGDLCFDLGSAYGNRTKHFLKLGASKVVVVEPTAYYQGKLIKKYGKDKRVVLLKVGIADKEGEMEINLCSSPTLSTFNQDEINDIKSNPQMANVEWIGKEKVKLVSLNNLIETYGMPDFVKIDIEGYEEKAFSTLKYAIPCMSFEYHTHFKEQAIKCIDYLSALGEYEFNYSMRESMKFALGKWCDADKIKEEIQRIDPNSDFGDIYLRKKDKIGLGDNQC